MSSKRLAVLLVLCSPLLAACSTANESGVSAFVADHWPHWAGGLPPDAPPRPGAPGYNEFIAHGEQDTAAPALPSAAAADGPTPEFVQTGSTGAGSTVVKPPEPGTAPASAPAASPRAKSKPVRSKQARSNQARSKQAPPPQPAPQAEPAPVPQEQQPSQDTSVTKGGLY